MELKVAGCFCDGLKFYVYKINPCAIRGSIRLNVLGHTVRMLQYFAHEYPFGYLGSDGPCIRLHPDPGRGRYPVTVVTIEED